MNPTDVFPRRNLPGAAEEWGRTVEQRIRGVEYAAITNRQSTSGLNRTTASNLEELSRQIAELEAVYDSIPKPSQASDTSSGFGLSAGWNTVVSVSLAVPKGMKRVDLVAIGSGQLVSNTTTTTVASQSRLTFPGVGSSPAVPGAWFTGYGDYRTVMVPTYSWRTNVTPGDILTINFQVNPADASAYGPNASSYAVLSVLATFTG